MKPTDEFKKPKDEVTRDELPRDESQKDESQKDEVPRGNSPVVCPYNNAANFIKRPQSTDIIRFTKNMTIDRMAFIIRRTPGNDLLNHLKSILNIVKTTKSEKTLLYTFEIYGSTLLYITSLHPGTLHHTMNLYQPTAEAQIFMQALWDEYPLYLSQVEVATDFYPMDESDLYPLRDILTEGLVLKRSRARCFTQYHDTTYIGKGGNVRHGTRGLRIYIKTSTHRFIRLELQLNRPHIKSQMLRLPIDASAIPLQDFVEYRDFAQARLQAHLWKRWRRPVRKPEDVAFTRGLEETSIGSFIDSHIGYDNDLAESRPTSDMMSQFKLIFKADKMNPHQYFPLSPKQAIWEDIERGFVRKTYAGTSK